MVQIRTTAQANASSIMQNLYISFIYLVNIMKVSFDVRNAEY